MFLPILGRIQDLVTGGSDSRECRRQIHLGARVGWEAYAPPGNIEIQVLENVISSFVGLMIVGCLVLLNHLCFKVLLARTMPSTLNSLQLSRST